MDLKRLVVFLALATGLAACDSANKAKSALESVSSSLNQSAIFDAEAIWVDSLQGQVAMVRDGDSLLVVPTNLEGDQFYFLSLRQRGEEDVENHSTPVSVMRMLPYFGDRESIFDEPCTKLMGFLEKGGDPKWVRALVYMTGGGDWYSQLNLDEVKVAQANLAKEEIDSCVARAQSVDFSTPLTFRNVSQTPDQELVPALIADDGSSLQYSFIRKLTDEEKSILIAKTKSFVEERKRVRENFLVLAKNFSYDAQVESAGLADVESGQALVLMEGNSRFRVAEDGE
jgi:hypothetical protein